MNGLLEHVSKLLASRQAAIAAAQQSGALLVTTGEAATILGVSKRTLEYWRVWGRGPTFRRVGSRVRYDLCDVLEWQAGNESK